VKIFGLPVNNNGYPRENSLATQTGSGLSGLAERVAKQDGHLEAGPQSAADVPGVRLLVNISVCLAVMD
jgi:glucose-6-phosphate-specific signal transduction histidine kinase